MFIVVTYDIADNRRRARVARCMEDFGRRVQYSVFDCHLGEKELVEVKTRLGMLIDHELDSVRFYRLCATCRQTIELLGRGTVKENEDLIIV